MNPNRRRFLQQSLLTLPALGSLSACGGGGGSSGSSGGSSGTTSTTAVPPPSGVDLSAGLHDYGTSPVPYTAMTKPTLLQKVRDPDFGTTMIRITDIANGPTNNGGAAANVAMPAYPSTQAWNCNETRLILYVTTTPFNSGDTQGWAMFDGKTYGFIQFLPINPSDIEQFWWSRTDPDILYYIDNFSLSGTTYAQLTSYNVSSGVHTVVHDFMPYLRSQGWPTTGPVRAGYPFANGGYYGVAGADNRIWGLMAGGIPNINGYLAGNCFGFDMLTGNVIRYASIPLAEQRTMIPAPRLSGNGWFWNDTNFASSANYQTWVLDGGGNFLRQLSFSSNEHIDTSLNAAGQDVLLGVQFDTPTVGNMIMANLETGTVSTIIGVANGYGYTRGESFVGSTAYLNQAWAVGSAVGSPYGTNNSGPTSNPTTLLDQEVFIANINTGAVYRVAHHRSTGAWSNATTSTYWAQPNVTISPSGTRILVQSDWGAGDPSNPVVNNTSLVVDTYVIELPSYTG
ncbi:MAG: hypothetical protein KGS28_08495 [Betaproteobacteria bacterium]|nr:hypothetical protein [Betaproteobacteria bacterium]